MSGPVVIVGAGPAGLAAARALGRIGAGEVLVLEREAAAGGVPRHCAHQGFGLRDLRRPLSGPSYAALRVRLAREAGAEVLAEATVTALHPDGRLEVTSPAGREELRPRALLLACGCRERPRSARMIAGDRPAGVMTTGTLQQLVQSGADVGRRAVVVGAEHVSFSALATLAHAGASAACMTTEFPRHQSLNAFRFGSALRWRVPLLTHTRLEAINGTERVEAVVLRDLRTGARKTVPCDTVVLSADWIPDHELAAAAGAELDTGSRGPVVDCSLRTSLAGVFAAGNILRGAEPADAAALEGEHAAAGITSFLADGRWPRRVRITCEAPLRWVSPGAIAAELRRPPRGAFALRCGELLAGAFAEVTQGRRRLWRGRLGALSPGRSRLLDGRLVWAVDPEGGPIRIALDPAGGGRS